MRNNRDKIAKVYQYTINNNGSYEDDWDFPIFSFVELTPEEFKAIIEKAHDEILKEYDEYWIRPGDIANKIVKIDDRFFHSKRIMTAVIDGWKNEDDWNKKFKGVFH